MGPLPFHPLINAWFTETYGKPTAVQEAAWPLIAEGEHVLALAPTGSGKTLTGFLAAISRFCEGVYPEDRLSVLYISPLKALNEDIKRNLTEPLAGIRRYFEQAGECFPAIRAETRSGDTPQAERRRFLIHPPSILALTPESLAILLLNPRGREVLSSVQYVILDEIHTAIGTKRGCFLSCQIDRLAMASGEFQRVGLSATVRPAETAADFAGGLRRTGTGAWEKRKVHIVSPPSEKKISLSVVFPELPSEATTPEPERYGRRYTALVHFILNRIRENRTAEHKGTILVFTDSRRRAERIGFLLNRQAENLEDFDGSPAAYTHHGSLSLEVRRAVEKGLAAGEIPCVVATSSLELGIDIGNVDEVILAGSPGSSATALQRIGRSGHRVGLASRGFLCPFNGLDLIQAAALAGAVEDRELEETGTVENPLDILAQIILALCAENERNEEELYELLRGFYIYRNLSRSAYDGVVRMLAGAYEETRLRELKRRIFRDTVTGTLTAAPGTLPLLYSSGGVIASRGYYSLRLAAGAGGIAGGAEKAPVKIGELDEEFVWERALGDCFDFGGRSWQITAIGPEAVEVIPFSQGAGYAPFWKADSVSRSPVLARRSLEIMDNRNRENGSSQERAVKIPDFSPEALAGLENFLSVQGSVQGKVPLPGPDFIPIEIIDDPAGRGDAYPVILHTFRGGAINYPLAMAMARDLEAEYGVRVESVPDNNAVLLRLPRSILGEPAVIIEESLRHLGKEGIGERRFREQLESSGVFGAAFREAAERSLLMPRSPFGKRIPLWVIRQRSKRLFDAVTPYRDFPATAEAWRTCINEKFDMKGFAVLLDGIGDGTISTGYFKTRLPSPFARNLAWAETNTLMYEYDERPDLKGPPSRNSPSGPSLSDEVIAEALGNAAFRPSLSPDLVKDFGARLRRELSGWAPEDALTLCEWVKERIAIPMDGENGEWERLLEAVPQELRAEWEKDRTLGNRLFLIRREGFAPVMVHRDWAKRWKEDTPVQLAEDCLQSWLRFEGPLPFSRISAVFGLSGSEAETAADVLVEAGELTRDVTVTEGAGTAAGVYSGGGLVCDRENLELLFRLSRKKQRPLVKERPARFLTPFLARRQGILPPHLQQPENIPKPWDKLAGLCAPVKLWETEFFPVRCTGYQGEILDREIREGKLLWYGAGKEKGGFCEPLDLDLALPPAALVFPGNLTADFFDTPRSFWEIKEAMIKALGESLEKGIPVPDSRACAEALWQAVWKGGLSSDSWEPLRRALETGFVLPGSAAETEPALHSRSFGRTLRVPRAIRERWRAGSPVPGNWFSLAGGFDDAGKGLDFPAAGPLEEEELNKDRVRLLLGRWGVLCRPLLERETPLLSWSRLLPAMRRMELAGELVAGRFFSGINSLQFASPRIAEELEEAEGEQGIFWMNGADPASPAGLAAAGLDPHLPARLPSSRLCFRGAELIALSTRSCKDLEIALSPEDPDLPEVLNFITFPKKRTVHPEKKIVIERINGKSAASGAYADILKETGFVNDRGKLVLW